MCIAAAHRTFVISETVADAGIFEYKFIQWPYSDLSRKVKSIIRDPYNNLKELGENLYQLLCVDMPFRKSIEGAL